MGGDTTIRRIIRGCGYVEGYGAHPGGGVLIMFVLMGAAAGAQRGGWVGVIVGAGAMLAVFGPMYLYGAWDRGRATQPGELVMTPPDRTPYRVAGAGSDLLPCPFCGGEPRMTRANGESWVACYECDASSLMCGTDKRAITAWNRRPSSPEIGERVEEQGIMAAQSQPCADASALAADALLPGEAVPTRTPQVPPPIREAKENDPTHTQGGET